MADSDLLTVTAGDSLSATDLTVPGILQRVGSRGFAFLRNSGWSISDFEHLTNELAAGLLIHANHRRERVNSEGTTQTVTPGTHSLGLHREMGALPYGPDLLFMYCERPADLAGETLLSDGVEILSRLERECIDVLSRSRLRWRYRVSRLEWERQFNLDSPEAAVRRIERLVRSRRRIRADDSYRASLEGDTIVLEYSEPTIFHERGRRPVFCNSLLYALHALRCANGRHNFSIDIEGGAGEEGVLKSVEDAVSAATVAVSWNAGDILVIDNWRMLHGRRSFDDPRRRILLRMGYSRLDLP